MSSDKPIKNSLLNLASAGFSLEDFTDARLLVPVVVPEQEAPTIKSTEDATAEIDLQSDDGEDNPTSALLPPSNSTTDSRFSSQPVYLLSQTGEPTPGLKEIDLNESEFVAPNEPPSVAPPPAAIWTASKVTSSVVSNFIPSIFRPATLPEQQPPPAPVLDAFSKSFEPELVQPSPPLLISTNPALQPAAPSILQPPSVVPSISAVPVYSVINTDNPNTAPSVVPPLSHPPLVPPPQTLHLGPTPPAVPFSAEEKLASTGSSQGLGNKYRLGQQKLQYAQYPGIQTLSGPSQTGIVATNAPPMPNAPPPTTFQPASASSLNSPSTPTYYSDRSSTGYVFGEPMPVRTVTQPQPVQYLPVAHHWFYRKDVEGKAIWRPFSFLDSVALEDAFTASSAAPVATDGGRYDVNVMERLRTPVYWEEDSSEVRRCSWFYKGPLDNRFIPYEEEFSQEIETEYEAASSTGLWNRRVELGGGEAIILHSSTVILHFCQAASPDEWGTRPENQLRPRVVKRGIDKSFMIEDGESSQIDHLVFLVHGIGAICDFKFRSIIEAVDDFRSLSSQMLHTHFGSSLDKGVIGRIEFLPVCWHKALHGDCGVDNKLKPITLPSIPKLRHFTNDTLLDILFYTSPVYCQRIVNTVGNEINRMYDMFLKRNLDFDGSVSLAGHSLGSLILFDLLSHQPSSIPRVDETSADPNAESNDNIDDSSAEGDVLAEKSSKMVSYTIGQAGTGQPSIVYPAFDFHPTCVFALGSPTAVFVSVRGIDTLGTKFEFPTCNSFFNIFHPYDPVAYRMEPLIDPTFDQPPVVIPHHKGRKRYHLEIKDAMFRMGADIKQTMVETIKSTWKTVYQFASFGRSAESAHATLEQEIDRVIEGEIQAAEHDGDQQPTVDVFSGQLNGGRRIDHVLQEAPLESFNEYLFALSSHVCYWESEDTMLFILKEIYQSIGISADRQVTQSSSVAGSVSGDSAKNDISSESYDPFHSQSINPGPSPFYEQNTTFPQQPQFNQPPMFPPPSNIPASAGTVPTFYNVSANQNYVNIPDPSGMSSNPAFKLPTAPSPQYIPMQQTNPASLPTDPGAYGAPAQSYFPDSTANSQPVAAQPPQPLGPPPLSGFVRK